MTASTPALPHQGAYPLMGAQAELTEGRVSRVPVKTSRLRSTIRMRIPFFMGDRIDSSLPHQGAYPLAMGSLAELTEGHEASSLSEDRDRSRELSCLYRLKLQYEFLVSQALQFSLPTVGESLETVFEFSPPFLLSLQSLRALSFSSSNCFL